MPRALERHATDWEKIFAKDTFDKASLSKRCQKLLELNNKKTNNWVKKWAKDLNRYLTKDLQMEISL